MMASQSKIGGGEMGTEFELVLDAQCYLARVNECIVSVWRGASDTKLVVAHYDLARRVIEQHRRVAMLIVIEPHAPPPSGPARTLIEQFYAHYAAELVCVGQVVEGGGFGQSAARAVMSTINLVVRHPYPSKIFSSAENGARWVAKQLATDELRAVVEYRALISCLQQARMPRRSTPRTRTSRPPAGYALPGPR